MTSNRQVSIRITSNSPDQNLIQFVTADLYFKADAAEQPAIYYRYPEPDPVIEGTMTTVKIKNEQIKIIRHGKLKSEQVFTLGKSEVGIYHTPEGSLSLETNTQSIDIDLLDGIGTISWVYDLVVSGTDAGKFEIKLDIQEEHKP